MYSDMLSPLPAAAPWLSLKKNIISKVLYWERAFLPVRIVFISCSHTHLYPAFVEILAIVVVVVIHVTDVLGVRLFNLDIHFLSFYHRRERRGKNRVRRGKWEHCQPENPACSLKHTNSTQPVNQAWWTKWGNVYFFFSLSISTLLYPSLLGLYWSPGDPRAACQSLGLRYQWNVTYTTERPYCCTFDISTFVRQGPVYWKLFFFSYIYNKSSFYFISIKFWFSCCLQRIREDQLRF